MRAQNYSRKRQAIYELMLSTDTHPTAEWIYTTLKPSFPDLSLGTVYRNLKLLEDNGSIKSVAVVDGCERYDARVTQHSHFVCKECGRVIDVFMSDNVDDVGLSNVEGVKSVDSYNLIFYGVCDKC